MTKKARHTRPELHPREQLELPFPGSVSELEAEVRRALHHPKDPR
jgi:hypothetical protein